MKIVKITNESMTVRILLDKAPKRLHDLDYIAIDFTKDNIKQGIKTIIFTYPILGINGAYKSYTVSANTINELM